jgi:hypothetical protein
LIWLAKSRAADASSPSRDDDGGGGGGCRC